MKSWVGCLFVGLLFIGNVKAQTWPEFHLTNDPHSSSYGVEDYDPLNPIKNLYIDSGATLHAGATELDGIYDGNEVFLNGGTLYASAIDANDFTWNNGELHLNGGIHATTYGHSTAKRLTVETNSSLELNSYTAGAGLVVRGGKVSVASSMSGTGLRIEAGNISVDSSVFVGSQSSNGQKMIMSGGMIAVKSGYFVIEGGMGAGGYNPGAIGNEASVTGSGLLDAPSIILGGGRGNRLLIGSGGQVRCESFSIYGDSTTGVVYPGLNNYASVSGNGSLLDISGDLSISSPDSLGAPGLPFDLPREIPAYLNISNGGEVEVGGEISVRNGSSLSLGSGGQLTVKTNFNASMNGFFFYEGSTLAVEGQLSGLSLLSAGQRLETPNVLGDLTVQGTFAPGNSPADSIVDGGLTIAADGTLEMELGGYALGSEYDRLTVTGPSDLDGTLDLIFLNSFSPTNGASFDLFNWEGDVSGSFSNDTNLTALAGGLAWDTSNLYTTGRLSVIPEPTVISLMAVFGGGLWVVRRYFPNV